MYNQQTNAFIINIHIKREREKKSEQQSKQSALKHVNNWKDRVDTTKHR